MSKLRQIPWSRATAEFLVIFLGVTLSLAADDWRQGRGDREAERAILQALSSDLSADSAELERFKTWMWRWDQSSLWLDRNMPRNDVSPDTAIVYVRRTLLQSFYRPVFAAYTAMKDGGTTSIIRDVRLRSEIVDYYDNGQQLLLQHHEQTMRWSWAFIDAATPHLDVSVSDSARTWWPGAAFTFYTSWDALRQDEAIRISVEAIGANSANFARLIDLALEENGALQAMIDQTLD